jgi:polyhydroxyalkanoate synthesis regulator phasin
MRGKILGSVVAGVLGLAVTGAAALAAFQTPDPGLTASATIGATGAAQTDKEGAHDRVKDVLDKLVANGTITKAQEEAIIKAFKEAAGDHDKKGELKHVLGDLFKLSSDYLGIPEGQLKQQLKDGKSLGEIADTTSTKSRTGLIKFLVEQVTAQVDKAVAEGKLTKEQAERIKSHLTEHVTKFVDHKFDRKAPEKPKAPKPTPTPTPTPKP